MLAILEPTIKLHCVYFTIWNGVIKNECPVRNLFDGHKPCVKLGEPCRYLQGEFTIEDNK